MGGRLSRQANVDVDGRWKEECTVLEDRLGYSPGVIYTDWRISADIRQRRSVALMPREVHEEMAFLDCLTCFDKQGCTPEVAN